MTDEHFRQRRRAIQTVGVVAIGALAGCADDDPDDDDPDAPDETPEEPDDEEEEVDDEEEDDEAEEEEPDDEEADLDEWFADDDTYDGVQDMTGEDEVEVLVGAEGNEGNNAYDPSAIEIDPGTTVIWEWTGEGGAHNVVDEADDPEFESELVDEEGFTFEHTFDDEGTYRYVCEPHIAQGMVGAVVVGENGNGEDEVDDEEEVDDEDEEEEDDE